MDSSRARSLHPHSWHVLVATPSKIPGTEFAERARVELGILVSPAIAYRLDGVDEPTVRVSFGGEHDRAIVAEGIE